MHQEKSEWVVRAETVAAPVLVQHAANVDEMGRWPKESMDALAQAGLMGLTVAAEYGGAGQGPRVFNTVLRVLAEACPSTAMIFLMHICGTQVIAAAQDFPQREPTLRDITAGKHLTTLAFSEQGSRSHFWAPVSQAVANGSQHVLTAQKSFVTSAGQADSYIVSTRAAGRDEPNASTLYFVEKDRPGFTTEGQWNGMGLRGNASAPMQLDAVTIPASNRLSAEGDGFNTMLQVVLPWFQLGTAAVNVGIAKAATEATRNHLLASKLQHLGQSLASLMNLRARLARMQILVDTHLAFLDEVARRMEQADPNVMLAVLESKAAAAETALEVTDLAMRTCGGAAFSKRVAVERYFRDARAGWVMAPTTDVLYDFIGKALLDMPLF